MHATYLSAVQQLLVAGDIKPDSSIIVTCGGSGDREVLAAAGLRNATITNLDRDHAGTVDPYAWQFADAEDLPFPDDSFDWGMVHAGLHHCRSPHRGLLELLRVSRKGVLVVEARESALMRLAVRLGFTPEYEIESVVLGAGTGGMRHGPIPNFIYRWTEREVRKTVESAMPGTVNPVRFFYGLRLPDVRMSMMPAWKKSAFRATVSALRLLFRMTPRQGNEFGFAIVKTGEHKPWIARDLRSIDPGYELAFDPARHMAAA